MRPTTEKRPGMGQGPSQQPGNKTEGASGGASALKQELRGKDFAAGERALAPPTPGGPGGAGAARDDGAKKKDPPGGTQPAPHSLAGLGKGRFNLFVEGQSAHFQQRVTVQGAKADLPSDSAPAPGVPIAVDAKGPWTLGVQHKAPPGTAWAKGRESWGPSTHKALSRGPDHLDVGTEDFKDNDFDDLTLSVVRADQDDGGAYLVESETKVEGAETSYDLVLGASASGRLDVMLNFQIISPDELGKLDKKALDAMSERFASLEGKVASSIDHEAKRKQLQAEIAGWKKAIAAAQARQGETPSKTTPKH